MTLKTQKSWRASVEGRFLKLIPNACREKQGKKEKRVEKGMINNSKATQRCFFLPDREKEKGREKDGGFEGNDEEEGRILESRDGDGWRVACFDQSE